MKWLLIITGLAILIDLAMGDPVRLRHLNFYVIKQVFNDIVSFLSRGEYQQLIQSNAPKH